MLTESQSSAFCLDHSTRPKVNTCGKKFPTFVHHISCFWVFTDQPFNSIGHITLPTSIHHWKTWLSNHLFIRQNIQKGASNKRVSTTLFKFIIKKKSMITLSTQLPKKKKKLFSKSMSNNDTRGPTQFNSNRCLSLNEEDVECLRYFSNFPIHTSMLFSILTPSTFFFHHLAHWNQRWKKNERKNCDGQLHFINWIYKKIDIWKTIVEVIVQSISHSK